MKAEPKGEPATKERKPMENNAGNNMNINVERKCELEEDETATIMLRQGLRYRSQTPDQRTSPAGGRWQK